MGCDDDDDGRDDDDKDDGRDCCLLLLLLGAAVPTIRLHTAPTVLLTMLAILLFLALFAFVGVVFALGFVCTFAVGFRLVVSTSLPDDRVLHGTAPVRIGPGVKY